MLAIKKLLYKKCIRSRTLTAEQKYKLYKNKLTTILRFAEKSYYSSLLVANKGDAKFTWNVLKGHCIEFKYYADSIHSGLTPPG